MARRPLVIAEQFYSIQGEGKYSGVPAVFLRLAGCNLMCGGKGTEKDGKLHDGATWRCDTIEVWRKGRQLLPEDVVANWRQDGTWDHFQAGAHLVVTGGEPLLQQVALNQLFLLLKKGFGHRFIEIETNGTVKTELEDSLIISYNCSPKLANSGMPSEMRQIHIQTLPNLYFKFVSDGQRDEEEILTLIRKFGGIHPSRVYLMPATESRDSLMQRSAEVAEVCKKHYFNFSSRHQVMIWDKTTGV